MALEKSGKYTHRRGGKARESESAGQNPPQGMKKLKNFEKIKRGK